MQACTPSPLEREWAAPTGVSLDRLYVLSVPIAAGISSVSGPRFGGLHYTGFIWMAYLCCGTLLVLRHPDAIRFPVRLWLPFVGLALMSLIWGGLDSFRQIQAILQWTTTVVVGMVASMTVRREDDLERLMRAYGWALLLVTGMFLFFHFGPGTRWQDSDAGRGFSHRTAAITLALLAGVASVHVSRRAVRRTAAWSGCLLLGIVTGSRMATACMMLAPLANPLWRSKAGKAGFVLGLGLLTVLLANTAAFQERFFHSGRGNLGSLFSGDLDSSGRDHLWSFLWSEALQRPFFGHGAGSSAAYLQKAGFLLAHPHNEYLRIVFEMGFVGLAVFMGAVVLQGFDCYGRALKAGPGVRYAFAAAVVGLFILLVISVTDNPLVYNLGFMHPLFALIGAAYGAAAGTMRLGAEVTVGATTKQAPPFGGY